MNRGKTGLPLIAITGICGQTSGTATVAGKLDNLGSSSSSSSPSSSSFLCVANDLVDNRNDVGYLFFAEATIVPDDRIFRLMNRSQYRDGRWMDFCRIEVKLLFRCLVCENRFDLEFFNAARSNELIFDCYQLATFIWINCAIQRAKTNSEDNKTSSLFEIFQKNKIKSHTCGKWWWIQYIHTLLHYIHIHHWHFHTYIIIIIKNLELIDVRSLSKT